MSSGEKPRRLLGGAKAVGGWLAGIAAAVVATIVTTWLLTPEQAKPDPNALPFTVAVRVQHGPSAGEGWIVTQPFAQIAARPSWGSPGWQDWAAQARGIPHGNLAVNFTVQGKTQAQVTLLDLSVRVVNRRPAVAGVLFGEIAGGESAFRAVYASLDSNPPKLTPYFEVDFIPDDTPEFERKPMKFPYEISLSDSETFVVEGKAKTCDCEWLIDLSWTAEGKTGKVTIDDSGKPFRVSGGANVTQVCSTIEGETCRPGPPRQGTP